MNFSWKTLEFLNLYVEANQRWEKDFTALKEELIQISQKGMQTTEVNNFEDCGEFLHVRVAFEDLINAEPMDNLSFGIGQNGGEEAESEEEGSCLELTHETK